jgi:hypothetical protein
MVYMTSMMVSERPMPMSRSDSRKKRVTSAMISRLIKR